MTRPLQVSLRVVSEAVGRLKEVHFVLFGQDMMDAFLEAAERQFGPAVAAAAQPEEEPAADQEEPVADQEEPVAVVEGPVTDQEKAVAAPAKPADGEL